MSGNAVAEILLTHAERSAYETARDALRDLKQGLTEPAYQGGLTRQEALDVVSAALRRIDHLVGDES